MIKSEKNLVTPYYPAPLLRDKLKLAKKWEDRKFSGDIKHNMLSTKKLEENNQIFEVNEEQKQQPIGFDNVTKEKTINNRSKQLILNQE